MHPRTCLALTLILSLLLARPWGQETVRVERKAQGTCAAMQCVRGCCAQGLCCSAGEQRSGPEQSAPAPVRSDVQLATLSLRTYTMLRIPAALRRPLVRLDAGRATHTLPPRAVSCIQLI